MVPQLNYVYLNLDNIPLDPIFSKKFALAENVTGTDMMNKVPPGMVPLRQPPPPPR